MVCCGHLAINYLQYRMALAYCQEPFQNFFGQTLFAQHRLEHFQKFVGLCFLKTILHHPNKFESCLQDVFAASPLGDCSDAPLAWMTWEGFACLPALPF